MAPAYLSSLRRDLISLVLGLFIGSCGVPVTTHHQVSGDSQGPVLAEFASDGFINAEDFSNLNQLFLCPANLTCEYAVIRADRSCVVQNEFSKNIPTASDELFAEGDGEYKICYRLPNKSIFSTDPFMVDRQAPVAELIGLPDDPSENHLLELTVQGDDVMAYKFFVGPAEDEVCQQGDRYSEERSQSQPIAVDLTEFKGRRLTVCSLARDTAGNWQDLRAATEHSWHYGRSGGNLEFCDGGTFDAGRIIKDSPGRFAMSIVNRMAFYVSELGLELPTQSNISFVGGSFPGNGGDCSSGLEPGARCTLEFQAQTNSFGIISQRATLSYQGVAGTVEKSCNLEANVVGAPGSADQSFALNGDLITAPGSYNIAYEAIPLAGGGFLAIDKYSNGSDMETRVSRHQDDGSLDTGFGTAGRTIIADPGRNIMGEASYVADDGSIYIVGSGLFAAALDDNGAPVGGFGTNGYTLPDTSAIGGSIHFARGVAKTSEGKLLVGGYYRTASSKWSQVVFRLNADGSLDTSYGTGGYDVSVITADGAQFYHMHKLPNGKIVAVGYATQSSQQDALIVQYDAAGNVDTDFGTNGVAIIPFSASEHDVLYHIDVQSDGKLIVGGYKGSVYEMVVARLNADGSLDNSFGSGGVATGLPTSDGGTFVNAIAVDQQDRVIAVGVVIEGADWQGVVARIDRQGAIDSSFADSGKEIFRYSTNWDGFVGASVQQDGKVLALGYVDRQASYQAIIRRFWP